MDRPRPDPLLPEDARGEDARGLAALLRGLAGVRSGSAAAGWPDVPAELARLAAELTGVDWLLVGELDRTRSTGPRVLASHGELHHGLGVGLALSRALELVLAEGAVLLEVGAAPTFSELGSAAPQGFAAVPIAGPDRRVVGVVAAFSRGPLERPDLTAEVLPLVAARAEAEMHRRRANACLTRRSRSAETLARIATRLLETPGDGSMRALKEALGTLANLHGAELAGLLVLAGEPVAVDEVVQWRSAEAGPGLLGLNGRRTADLPWSDADLSSGTVAQCEWIGPPGAEADDAVPRRMVAVPVGSGDAGGRWIGVLALTRTGPAWRDAELPELRIAAATLVGALLRERRDRRRRRRVERLRLQARAVVSLARSATPPEGDELVQIAEMAAATLDVDLANIWLFNAERSFLVHQCSFVRGIGGTTGADVAVADHPRYFTALFENRFVDADDARNDPRTSEFRAYYERVGVHSALDAAVRVEGRTIGVICLEHRGGRRRWEEDEKGFAGTIADLVALAVEERDRRRTAAALAVRNRELEVLNLIHEAAQEVGPLDALYRRIVAEVARVTSFPVATIGLVDEERGALVLEAYSGVAPPPGVERVEIDLAAESPSARAVRTGQQVVLTGDDLHPLHVRFDGVLRLVLCTPLIVRGRIIGALGLGTSQPPRDLASIQPLAQSLAHAVSVLIERRRAREQEILLDKQAAEAQRLEAVATLAGGIAHDFNNLMTGVMGYTALLKQNAEPGSEVYTSAEMIEGAAERAGELTQQLLSYGRRGKKRDVVFDVHRIASEVASLVAPALPAGVQLALALDAESAVVRGDPGQLHQALMNLAVNARDAMPGGGTVRIASRDVDTEDVDDPALRAGRYLEVEVADDGIGIGPEVLHRIFEPFFTTKDPGKGTGMGLAMVYGIAVDHGGAIRVESRPGEGAVFRLLLPLHDEDGAGAPDALPARGSGVVWIADDEAIVRGTAAEILRSLGYVVAAFPDGASLVEGFRAHGDDVDLVLLDIVMPGMDGRETLRALRALRPDVRVLLTSGWDRAGAERGALEEGALGFLPKPYQLEVLAETVARVLRGEPV